VRYAEGSGRIKDIGGRRKETGYASDILPWACKMCRKSLELFMIMETYTR